MTITRLFSAEVYPSTPQPQYPEQKTPRFDPKTHPIGVCFSGGGPRSMTASMGQMRGLMANPKLYDAIGAISCVSGGSWFGSLFSYADPTITDAQLLGAYVPPGQLTAANIATVDRKCLAYGLTHLTNSAILASITASFLEGVPSNRLYARMLNATLLANFKIADPNKFFSVDAASVNAIIANNIGLTPANFYVMRQNRPYFVAGSTQIYPIGSKLVMRHFEYSPLYDGTPQLFTPADPGAINFGGGYVQNFAFDSSDPAAPGSDGLVQVSAPLRDFTISDLMGSSGAAPGSMLDQIGIRTLFAQFHYWPPRLAGQPNVTAKYSFVDGGDLENTGIVPLLRRQFPIVIACINTSIPMNGEGTYQGIDYQIAALFGYQQPEQTTKRELKQAVGMAPASEPKPEVVLDTVRNEAEGVVAQDLDIPQQNVEVFPQADFAAVRDGLQSALKGGGPVYAITSHTIVPNNPFGIEPYPNGGKVTVVWLYNEKVAQWADAITDPMVKQLLTSTDKRNYMANFPNYWTVLQNRNVFGVPELLMLTPQQVNLLANMWTFNVGVIGPEIQKLLA